MLDSERALVTFEWDAASQSDLRQQFHTLHLRDGRIVEIPPTAASARHDAAFVDERGLAHAGPPRAGDAPAKQV